MIRNILKTLVVTTGIMTVSAVPALAQSNECKVVTQGPGGLTDQLFRIMEKHNPDFKVTYRISLYNVTALEVLERNPEYMMLSPPVFYSKQNPRPNPNIEHVKVLSSSNAAIATAKDITIQDLANKKLNVGIPAFAQYSHVLSLTLKQKNPDINIIVVPAKDAPPMLKNGDLDIYIHTEPTIDTFVTNFNVKKIAVVAPDKPTDFNGIQTKSLHFSSIWVNKDATPAQKEHVKKCIEKIANNPAFIEDIAKTGSTVRLNIPENEKDRYLSDFINLLKKWDL
jgi:tripartite-type tricarboxylate transporter receptor subunit TctC